MTYQAASIGDLAKFSANHLSVVGVLLRVVNRRDDESVRSGTVVVTFDVGLADPNYPGVRTLPALIAELAALQAAEAGVVEPVAVDAG